MGSFGTWCSMAVGRFLGSLYRTKSLRLHVDKTSGLKHLLKHLEVKKAVSKRGTEHQTYAEKAKSSLVFIIIIVIIISYLFWSFSNEGRSCFKNLTDYPVSTVCDHIAY